MYVPPPLSPLPQVKLARLKTFIQQRCGGGVTEEERGGEKGVFQLERKLQLIDLTEMSSSRLYKTIGCLVDVLLLLTGERGDTNQTGEDVEIVPQDQLPTLTEDECSLMFTTLCIHGVPKLHARACALLIRLCGSQQWWGRFLTSAATQLFGSRQTAIFNKERSVIECES